MSSSSDTLPCLLSLLLRPPFHSPCIVLPGSLLVSCLAGDGPRPTLDSTCTPPLAPAYRALDLVPPPAVVRLPPMRTLYHSAALMTSALLQTLAT